MVLELARQGYRLTLAARRADVLEALADECRELGAGVLAVPTDVTDAGAMAQLAFNAHEQWGRIDVWINNAGVLAAGPFDETPLEVHKRVIETNLIGYLHGAYAALPYFKQQQKGLLINNISIGAWFPTPYAVGYSASKFGLRGFSEALKGELLNWPGIEVCDLYPAFLDTPGIQHAANYSGRALRPAPPVYDPQRIARAVRRLIESPASRSYITAASPLLKWTYALFPGLTRRLTARFIEAYFRNADPIAETEGNLFQPAAYGTSIHGGWNPPVPARKALAAGLLAASGVMLLLGLAGRR